MYLTIRKSNPTSAQPTGGVVIEVKMSLEDAQAHHHRSVLLEEVMEDAMQEHMHSRATVNRRLHMGSHG